MEHEISRRGFLSGAAAAGVLAAASLAGCGNSSSASSASSSTTTASYDMETEVLVCGYGAAGAACAIDAADAGSKVLIIEKAKLPGGSMGRCGGAIMGAGTKVQEKLGVKDDADGLYDWVNTCVNAERQLCPTDIIRTYADNAGKNVDWLMDMCTEYCGRDLFEVAMATENSAVSEGDAPDAESGSGGGNGITSGCLNAVGCEYDKFGLSAASAVPRSHWAHAIYDSDCNSGPELFEPLYENINSKVSDGAVTVEFETALSQLIQAEDGTVIGVVATDASGKEVRIKASKGVMLATGGFCASEDMKLRFCYDSLETPTYMCKDCTGDGILAAMEVGADLYNMSNYYPLYIKQTYTYETEYNDVFNSWDMDDEGVMEVANPNMAESHGGVKINTSAQVMDVRGNVIPHLYASGCDVGTNIFGIPSNYPGCGCYVSFSICYGRIAGTNLAAESAIA